MKTNMNSPRSHVGYAPSREFFNGSKKIEASQLQNTLQSPARELCFPFHSESTNKIEKIATFSSDAECEEYEGIESPREISQPFECEEEDECSASSFDDVVEEEWLIEWKQRTLALGKQAEDAIWQERKKRGYVWGPFEMYEEVSIESWSEAIIDALENGHFSLAKQLMQIEERFPIEERGYVLWKLAERGSLHSVLFLLEHAGPFYNEDIGLAAMLARANGKTILAHRLTRELPETIQLNDTILFPPN